jgi:hypothetical protein
MKALNKSNHKNRPAEKHLENKNNSLRSITPNRDTNTYKQKSVERFIESPNPRRGLAEHSKNHDFGSYVDLVTDDLNRKK